MKRLLYLTVITATLLMSCTDYEIEESQDKAEGFEFISKQGDASNMLTFSSRQALADAIDGNFNVCAQTRSTLPTARFVSLLDKVQPDDPVLDSLSQEEKDYVLSNHLTYYEAFGYEELVPNEGFAALLSNAGEILVNDTIYKVTDLGTLCAAAVNYNSMIATNDSLHRKNFKFQSGESYKIFPNGSMLINTFGDVSHFGDLTIEGMTPIIGPDKDKTSDTDGNKNSDSGSSSTNTTTSTNKDTPLDQIPFKDFPFFDTESHTIFAPIGKLLGLGDRSTKHHEYEKGRRVDGSLYCYNYYVYHETGVYVSMSRKRGGFFKFINGWKKIQADELVIDLENIVFKMEIKLSDEAKAAFEKANKVYGYTTNTQYSRTGKVVNILGYDIKEADIYRLTKLGVKEAQKLLGSLTHSTIDSRTQAAQILTPTTAYIIIFQDPIHVHNQQKYRRVFDAGVQFVISSELIKHPLEIKTWREYIKLYDYFPKLGLVSGTARIAGRLDGKWGGMTIEKKDK